MGIIPFMGIYCVWGTVASMPHVGLSYLDINMELATTVNPFCR